MRDDKALARDAARVQAMPANAAYQEKIEIGRRVDAAINAGRMREREQLQAVIDRFALRQKALSFEDDMMFLNAAMLVEAAAEPALYAAVAAHEAARDGRFIMKYLAPVPPYNFVSLSLDWSSPAPQRKVA